MALFRAREPLAVLGRIGLSSELREAAVQAACVAAHSAVTLVAWLAIEIAGSV